MTITPARAARALPLTALAAAAVLAAAGARAEPLVSSGDAADSRDAYVELIIDGSGSMAERIDGGRKIDVARKALTESLRGMEGKKGVRTALRAYGHTSPKSLKDCRDTRIEVPFGEVSAASVDRALAAIEPKGFTPLEYTIREAGKDLEGREDVRKAIVLFTDGIETCGGDPCRAARELRESGLDVTIHVVGFALDDKSERLLECIAVETGGLYLKPKDAKDLREAFKQAIQAAAEFGTLKFEMNSPEGPVQGVVAYVIEPASGTTVTAVKSGGPRDLPPGRYTLSAEVRPTRVTREFSIESGKTTVVSIGEVGSIGFKLLGPEGQELETFAYVQDPKTGDTIGTVRHGKTMDVSPGVYNLEVQTLPSPILREGVKVEAGRTAIETVKTVGRLELDVRGVDGKRLLVHGYVTDVKTGDTQGTVDSGRSVDLIPGDYRIEVETIPPTVREPVAIRPGKTATVRIDAIGRLRLDAADAEGRPARIFAYVIDKASTNTLGVVNSGQELDLVAGTYRLEVQTSPPQVRESVAIEAGKVTRVEVKTR